MSSAAPAAAHAAGGGAEEIITLEDGFNKVHEEGIKPFISFIESNERQFFRAKDFVKLYNLVFKMCIQREPHNCSAGLYERYTHTIQNYIKEYVSPKLQRALQDEYMSHFLKEWAQRWHNHKLFVRGLSKVFMYLDRFYTPTTDGVCPLKEQGFRLYKQEAFEIFKEHARNAVLAAFQKERENEEQDRHLLKQACDVFLQIGYDIGGESQLEVYHKDLQNAVVAHAGAYYARKARTWLDVDSCPVYMEKAEQCLEEEKSRVAACLHQSTLDPLTRAVYQQLLAEHQSELLSKSTGMHHLLEVNSTEDLARLFRLYSQFNAEDLEPLGNIMHDHIRDCGKVIVEKAQAEEKSPDASHALVRNLIELHERYARMVNNCFDNHATFQRNLKSAFESFINIDNRVARLLARFVDDVLRKHSKVRTQDVEGTLDNVVFLYGYISEKDVFEQDYQRFLSRRLLTGMCESEHAEKSMIAKLKTQCGYSWVGKLEGMFKDIKKSQDLTSKFREVHANSNLDVSVCTTGYWPASQMVSAALPKDMQAVCEKYRRFYLDRHSGHKLEWRMDQGQAEIEVRFGPTMMRGLICTTYQMMIMLMFNDDQVVSYQQILEITKVPGHEIANHLLSLAHPTVKVLLKKPNVKDLEEDHQFKINPKFASQLRWVQIPLLLSVENKRQAEEEAKALEHQRKHQIDAGIIRIMKTRKTLKHNQLVTEVIAQLSARFKPKPITIKKRIESLIETEYLARDEDDRSTYKYLA